MTVTVIDCSSSCRASCLCKQSGETDGQTDRQTGRHNATLARLKGPERGGGNGVAASSCSSSPSSPELSTIHGGDAVEQGVAPSHSCSHHFAPLTRRPASFSVNRSTSSTSGNNPTTNSNAHTPSLCPPHQQLLWTAGRARSGSCDNSAVTIKTSTSNTNNHHHMSNNTRSRWQFGAIKTATWTPGDDIMPSTTSVNLLNSEGFPALLRRRTFTEPTRTKSRCSSFVDEDADEEGCRCGSDGAGSGGGGSARVPMSMSEDNMLRFVSTYAVSESQSRNQTPPQLQDASRRHRHHHAPQTPPPTPTNGGCWTDRGSNSSISISSSGSVSSGDEDNDSRHFSGVQEGQQQQQQQHQRGQPTGSAIDLARRNAFVMRYTAVCVIYHINNQNMEHESVNAAGISEAPVLVRSRMRYHTIRGRVFTQDRRSDDRR